MPELFAKARQHRIFQDVVDQIQAAILDGRIEPGDRLPPERELVEVFQTSRPTLREALRILEQKGLIEIRLGASGGAYVRDPNSELMAENLAMLIRSQNVSLPHLAEFREGVEGLVAGLAASRATVNDIASLNHLTAQAELCRKQGLSGWQDLVRVDEQIHLEIARIAGNPLFSFVLHSIHQNIHRYYDKFLRVGPDELEENYRDLAELCEAVSRRDSAEAARLAREHVRRFSGYMEQKVRRAG